MVVAVEAGAVAATGRRMDGTNAAALGFSLKGVGGGAVLAALGYDPSAASMDALLEGGPVCSARATRRASRSARGLLRSMLMGQLASRNFAFAAMTRRTSSADENRRTAPPGAPCRAPNVLTTLNGGTE